MAKDLDTQGLPLKESDFHSKVRDVINPAKDQEELFQNFLSVLERSATGSIEEFNFLKKRPAQFFDQNNLLEYDGEMIVDTRAGRNECVNWTRTLMKEARDRAKGTAGKEEPKITKPKSPKHVQKVESEEEQSENRTKSAKSETIDITYSPLGYGHKLNIEFGDAIPQSLRSDILGIAETVNEFKHYHAEFIINKNYDLSIKTPDSLFIMDIDSRIHSKVKEYNLDNLKNEEGFKEIDIKRRRFPKELQVDHDHKPKQEFPVRPTQAEPILIPFAPEEHEKGKEQGKTSITEISRKKAIRRVPPPASQPSLFT